MEFTAKTVEEAVKQGLEELSLTEENAIIEIVSEPTKGFFGKLKGQAVVKITAKEQETKTQELTSETGEEQKAVELVEKVLEFLEIEADASLSQKNERTVITLKTEDSSALIGYRGEVLDALQTLAGAMANKGKAEYKKVVVDCENYRDRREETLIKLAHRLEQKATEIRRDVILEPMSPFERRIIHTALAQSETVKTESSGKEPNRYVVIVPNDKDEFSKPYNAGRNNDKKGGRNDRRQRGGNQRRQGGKNDRRSSSFSQAPKKKSTISFGTYLGNSLKDKE